MSLFGDDDTPVQAKQSSSLFDDGPKATKKAGSGLFSDDVDTSNDSPWDFPSPKKAARGNVVKSLLPATDVPESYIDAFDSLLAAGDGEHNEINIPAVKRILSEARLGGGKEDRILEIITRGQNVNGLSRSEFNVLLALIGLAQEGEDVTLDSVDERRKRLPEPSITIPKRPQPQAATKVTETGQPPATPSSAPSSRPATMNKQSFGFPENDPWGSPVLHKGHNHTNNAQSSVEEERTSSNGTAAVRTTSAFTTNSAEPSESGATNPTIPTRSPGNSEGGGWGGFEASNTTLYSGNGLTDDGFGADGSAGGGSGRDRPSGMPTSLGGSTRLPGNPAIEEVITVTLLQEKEGMFMFQHRNYQVTSARRNSSVFRRYSDFVWLLDCLQKRYPFRQLPLLPPKRVAINGNHIAAESSFIEKRRRGLVRFVNALVRHPILAQEQLVVMFLTVPTELSVWRKQATISVQEEFEGKTLPPGLEDSLPNDLMDLFERVRSGVRRSADVYINMCNLLERFVKRNEGLAAENLRFATALGTLAEASEDTYAIDTNNVPLLNEGLKSTAKHLSSSQTLLEDEAKAWDEGVLEDLKRQRDSLVSMRDLFDRRDRYARDNIPQLEKKIASNETKLAGIRAKPEHHIKPGEAEKVEDAIVKDKQSIVDQHARGVFIKECVRDELVFFQQTQYHVSRLHQDWSQERVKYAELQADNWRALSEEVEAMPLGD